MALSQTARIATAVSFFGVLAFILGVIAENKKPASGTPIKGKGVVICQYPSDPTILLGSFSIVMLFIATALGLVSVFYPYRGKSVPIEALFRSTTLLVFFTITVGVTVLAEGMMIWATATEGLHRARNVHHNLENQCPTAKTGLFGGAAFLALDAALFWLICQMLSLNARADYLDEEEEEDLKGEYGQVVTADYDTNNGPGHPNPRV
uniref:Beta-klotho n=1 Tax=Anthurium amnicola TaxID=1678845 RepID=A0A1D1Y4L6_9ARAE